MMRLTGWDERGKFKTFVPLLAIFARRQSGHPQAFLAGKPRAATLEMSPQLGAAWSLSDSALRCLHATFGGSSPQAVQIKRAPS